MYCGGRNRQTEQLHEAWMWNYLPICLCSLVMPLCLGWTERMFSRVNCYWFIFLSLNLWKLACSCLNGGGGGGGYCRSILGCRTAVHTISNVAISEPSPWMGRGGVGGLIFIADLFLDAEQLYTQYLMWPSVNLTLGVGGGRVGGIADLFVWVQENSCTHKI